VLERNTVPSVTRIVYAKHRSIEQGLAFLCADGSSETNVLEGFVVDFIAYLDAVSEVFVPIAERALGRRLLMERSLLAAVVRLAKHVAEDAGGSKGRSRYVPELNTAFRSFSGAVDRITTLLEGNLDGNTIDTLSKGIEDFENRARLRAREAHASPECQWEGGDETPRAAANERRRSRSAKASSRPSRVVGARRAPA
jgi:hypothetical protein